MPRSPKANQATADTATETVVDPRNEQDDTTPTDPAEQIQAAHDASTVEAANGAPEVPPTPDYTQQASQAALNLQAQQAKGEGMEVGNIASESRYAPMGADGQPDLSKIQAEPVEGYGVQVVAKGDVIDQATYDRLNAHS